MSYSDDEPDFDNMAHICNETPLEEGSRLTFKEASSSPSIVRVTGLRPSTADDAVKFFFSNKRRNHGGPVDKVERSADKQSALVYFQNPEDAEAVVKKGDHTLDDTPLHVALHEDADDSDGSKERRFVSSVPRESFSKAGLSFDDAQTSGQEGGATQFRSSLWTSRNGEDGRGSRGHGSSGLQQGVGMSSLLFSSDSRTDKINSLYTSSASAQMKHGGEVGETVRDPTRYAGGHSQYDSSRYGEDPGDISVSQTYRYGGHTGRSSSKLIDFHQSPKKDKNEFKVNERAESRQSNQYSNANHLDSFDSENLQAPPAGSAKPPESSSQNQQHDLRIKLEPRAMWKIMENPILLRELTSKLRGVGARFCWKQPDHILIKCLLDEPTAEWGHAVRNKINHFLSLVPQYERQAAEKEKLASQKANEKLASQETDNSSWRSKNNHESDDDDALDMPSPFSKASQPAAGTETHMSAMVDDVIPNLKACQFKVLSMPTALERFYRGYPGLHVSLDAEGKTAKVTAPEDVMQKAFSDVLGFVTGLREKRMPLTPGLLKMFEKEDTREWIQETVFYRHEFVCHWEVSEKHIIISGQPSDLERIQQMLQEAFQEKTVRLDPEEACALKSPAWRSFLEGLEEAERSPKPVLLPEGDSVAIVDTPSNISDTQLKLKTFLGENRREEKTLEISPDKVKCLTQFCEQDLKELSKKAQEEGVTVTFNKKGLRAQGPKESLPGVVGEVKEMVGRVKEDKMTFKKPGMARYLTSPRGRDFLAQTGSATKCHVTTGTDGEGGGGAAQSGSRVLAKVKVSLSLTLQIIQGDITQCPVDAIVNAANGRLKHDGGVAAAIVKAGGKCIQDDSDELVAENGNLKDGEVAVTGAGTLPCTHVIHAVGPIWSGGRRDEENVLVRTVESILKEAEERELTSIAVPAISCGIFGYPVDRATDTIVRTIGQFFRKAGREQSVQNVLLIDMNAEPLEGFISAAKSLFGKSVEVKDKPTPTPAKGKHGGASYKTSERTERDSHRSRSDYGHDDTPQGPIKIIPGEIAKSRADVIVCTTHPSLDLQKGVLSKSILHEGGEVIQQELKKYHDRFGTADLGKIVRTSGGNLRCKFVFHLSLPSWRDDRGQTMKSAVKACLDEANKRRAKTIAFPTLGTGRLGYPSEKVAAIMQSAISQWFSENRHSNVKEVQIIVFSKDTETLKAFKDSDRHSGGHSGGRGHGHRGGRGGDASYSGGRNGCRVKVGKMTVVVKEGNILEETCDAIVNSSNDSLDLTKGAVSKAIMQACGRGIILECEEQKDQMGEMGVAVTRVDGIACGHVIHVSADRFKGDWVEGILAVLRLADEERIATIAIPALGTGVRGADPEELARAMKEAVTKFSRRPQYVREVRVVVFQRQLLRPYISAFDPDTSRTSPHETERSDSPRGASANVEAPEARSVDVIMYALEEVAIKEAREKIYRHMKSIFTSKTETHSVIGSFNPKQKEEMFKLQKKHNVEISLDDKKGAVTFTGIDIDVTRAVSDLKDIILSATTQRHLAAGGPPVRWQYQTGKDKFADFDPEATLTIEAAFKKKERSVQFKDKRGRHYKIVFKDRKEYSLDNPRAEPVAVKRRDILEERKQDIPLPDHWEPMKGNKVKKVALKPDSQEYKRVAAHFSQQGLASIKKIERIQNPSLFQQYKIKKKELEQYNPKGTENEKRLFHGTSSDSVEGIITNGFNRSYCGKNGTALGNGVYFAADSATSMGYAHGGQMFQARVLVGEYTPGSSGLRMAPNKPRSNRPYDSVSDGQPPQGSVFVIFHDSQAYPEYLISF